MKLMFLCNREVRVIPRGWTLPKAATLSEDMPDVSGLSKADLDLSMTQEDADIGEEVLDA